MLYYFEDREGNPIYLVKDYWNHDTVTPQPNNGTYFPEVRECPLCKGTGLIKVGKDPVGHADT